MSAFSEFFCSSSYFMFLSVEEKNGDRDYQWSLNSRILKAYENPVKYLELIQPNGWYAFTSHKDKKLMVQLAAKQIE